MPDVISSIAASTLFGARNLDKVVEQDRIDKAPVVVGQGASVFKRIATLDNSIGKGAKTAIDAFKVAAEGNKLIDYTAKAVNYASNHVNLLIGTCALLNAAAQPPEKRGEAVAEATGGLVCMFGAETLMNKCFDEIPKMESMKGITEPIMEFAAKNKCEGKIPSIIRGVAFFLGSTTAYEFGRKTFGTMVAKQFKPETATVAESEPTKKANENIKNIKDVKAINAELEENIDNTKLTEEKEAA